MANPAFKLAIGIYILSAVISFFSATGVINLGAQPAVMNEINESKWNTMTDPGAVSEGNPLDNQQEAYQSAGFDIVEWIKGSVYVKGVLDQFCQYQWPYTLFTGILQALIYIITIWGVLSWVLNRTP